MGARSSAARTVPASPSRPSPDPPMPVPADSSPPRPPRTPSGHAPVPAYRNLRVWRHALDLAVDVAPLARTLDAAGLTPLATDLLRTGTAVPGHIAAGSVTTTRSEFQRALATALATVARLETLLATADRLAPATASHCAALLVGTGDLTRQLRAFARAVATPAPGGAAVHASSPPPGARPGPLEAPASASRTPDSTQDSTPAHEPAPSDATGPDDGPHGATGDSTPGLGDAIDPGGPSVGGAARPDSERHDVEPRDHDSRDVGLHDPNGSGHALDGPTQHVAASTTRAPRPVRVRRPRTRATS